MIKKRTTDLNVVLADWDEMKFPDGREKIFSVGFVNKKGELRFVKKGKKAGLKFNMKNFDVKAVQPVSVHGDDIGHIYPVWIHSILFYSGTIEMNLLNING